MSFLPSYYATPPDGAVLQTTTGPKVYELPAWGKLSNEQRIGVISKIGRDAARDPCIRRLAVSILNAANVGERDYRGAAAALLKFVQDNVRFVNECDEVLQAPQYTLDMQDDGTVGPLAAGDCDDKCSTLIALCHSIHLPVLAVTSGKDRAGRTVRYVEGQGRSPRVNWSHIYCAVGPHPFRPRYDPKTWLFADGSVRGWPLGRDVLGMGLSDPQLGRIARPVRAARRHYGDPDAEVVKGLTWIGAAQMVGVGVATAFICSKLKKAGLFD